MSNSGEPLGWVNGAYYVSQDHGNPKPQPEGMLDRTSVTGESGEGEGGFRRKPSVSRPKGVSLDFWGDALHREAQVHLCIQRMHSGEMRVMLYDWINGDLIFDEAAREDGQLHQICTDLYDLYREP